MRDPKPIYYVSRAYLLTSDEGHRLPAYFGVVASAVELVDLPIGRHYAGRQQYTADQDFDPISIVDGWTVNATTWTEARELLHSLTPWDQITQQQFNKLLERYILPPAWDRIWEES